ncbi:MAG: PAS domain-containing protein [Ilumatobacteraceae bacterium]
MNDRRDGRATAGDEATLEGRTALVIDDSVDNRFFIRRWLAKHGAVVIEAANGAEGLELARQLPDLVVCDVRLPDMDGRDVTASIKTDPMLRQIPVIQRSSIAIDLDDRVGGLSSGADAYLVEPIDEELLIATAMSLLRFQRVSQQLEAALSVDVTGIFDWSIDAGRVRWSESLELIHGLAPGGFGGAYDDFLDTVHPADRDRVVDNLAASLEGDHTVALDFRFVRADGSHGWMESRGSIFRDRDGRPIRLLGLSQDVTDSMIERSRVDQLRRLASALNAARSSDAVLFAAQRELHGSGVALSWAERDDEPAGGVIYMSVIGGRRLDLVRSTADAQVTDNQARQSAISRVAPWSVHCCSRPNATTPWRCSMPCSLHRCR